MKYWPKKYYPKHIIKIFLFLSLFLSPAFLYAGENYALLIGIDKYAEGINFPATASKDALLFAELLENKFNFKVKKLLGASADKASIIQSLESIAKSTKKEDAVIIYYSGASEIENLYGYGWWLPSDAKLNDSTTYIEVSLIQQILRQTEARRLLLISDAAFPDSACSSFNQKSPKVLPDSDKDLYAHSIIRHYSSGKLSKDGKQGLLLANISSLLSKNEGNIEVFDFFKELKSRITAANGSIDYSFLRTGKQKMGDPVFLKLQPKEEVLLSSPAVKETKMQMAALNISSPLSGVRLSLNSIEKGNLPLRLTELKPGKYTIELYAPKHENLKEEITLAAGETRELNFIMIPEKIKDGQLLILSRENAKINFKDNKLNYSPNISLPPGSYLLEVSAPLHQKEELRVDIKEGKSERKEVKLKLLDKYKNSLNMDFLGVNPGSFIMGSPENETRRSKDEKEHKVTISSAFFMQQKAVTVKEWKEFIKESGYKTGAESGSGAYAFEKGFRWAEDHSYNWKNPLYPLNDNLPVSAVSYNDAMAFIDWLSKKEGLNYALPTEAQWEYAARAGTKTSYAYGDCLSDKEANFAANSFRQGCPTGIFRKEPLAVGSLLANAWGFFDMHGNVWEWCEDWYGEYPEGELRDPSGPDSGQKRVLRGGGWESDLDSSRVAKRYSMEPSLSYTNVGFRLILKP